MHDEDRSGGRVIREGRHLIEPLATTALERAIEERSKIPGWQACSRTEQVSIALPAPLWESTKTRREFTSIPIAGQGGQVLVIPFLRSREQVRGCEQVRDTHPKTRTVPTGTTHPLASLAKQNPSLAYLPPKHIICVLNTHGVVMSTHIICFGGRKASDVLFYGLSGSFLS